MKLKHLLLLISFFAISCEGENNTQIIQLFTENVQEWETQGNARWHFENDELIAESDSGLSYILTKDVYSDFELTLEFFPDSTVNSGVFIACNSKALDAENCHEMNIWDLHPNQDFRTGSIVTKVMPYEKVNTLNKWNTYKITLNENNVEVFINNILTAKLENGNLKEGYIALQVAEKGEIKFRNVQLRKLNN